MSQQRTMIIAMVVMAVMQFTIAEIIEMVTMGHALVARRLMITGASERRAGRGMRAVNCDYVFVVVITMAIMQVPIVQVIGVALVRNSQVAAVLAMDMRMLAGVGRVLHNCILSQQS